MSAAVENAKTVPNAPPAPPSPTTAKKAAEEARESELKKELTEQAKDMLKEKAQEAAEEQMVEFADAAKEELAQEAASSGWFGGLFSCSCSAPEMPNLDLPNMEGFEIPDLPDAEELKLMAVRKAAEAAGVDPELAVLIYEMIQNPEEKGPEVLVQYGKEKIYEYAEIIGVDQETVDSMLEKIQEKMQEKLEELQEGEEKDTKKKDAKDNKDSQKKDSKDEKKDEKKDKDAKPEAAKTE